MNPQSELSKLPAVDHLLQMEPVAALISSYGHTWVVDAIRAVLAALRQEILSGAPAPTAPQIVERIELTIEQQAAPTLRPVINAAGVILHTNLGRAPLSSSVVAAMAWIGPVYSNLEYDLAAGQRGSRYIHAEDLLMRLTGAQAALVVNNNAAAVLLALSALARDREVIISRSQLVEIGGGFRIPEVLAASSARLVEVGTTNRTYVHDYQAAVTPQTAAILRVHQSNFRLQGFVHQPALHELAELAHDQRLLLVDDLGSGTLLPTELYGLPHEPTVQESLEAGADLVTFSGDKLLGGPQAGIIVGRAELVARLREFPLTRALRVDKTAIAGIQANLLHYAHGEAQQAIPVWRMIAATAGEIHARAEAFLLKLGETTLDWHLIPGRSMIGGGALPEESLPTTLLALPVPSAQRLAAALRRGDPPVVARVEEDTLLFDLRTVLPEQEDMLAERLRSVLAGIAF
ncbi:MAG: L-seryl-tRNA(Sec) selenium transferase [Chloroflexi bacterium]|nr:L-seryl-tRNA(Sec) selenium transferase [Chloroflexota bacterium]